MRLTAVQGHESFRLTPNMEIRAKDETARACATFGTATSAFDTHGMKIRFKKLARLR
jgi:hypothetical protein